MRPVVNTEKHIIQFSLSVVASGAITVTNLANAVAVPASNSSHIREGAKISAVYVEMWVQSDDATAGTVIFTIQKLPGPGADMTAAQSASLNTYTNKKNIFFTQMGLIPNNVTYPMVLVKGWIKIPKSKQRFGLTDRLQMTIHGQSNGLSFCGFVIYKEQY